MNIQAIKHINKSENNRVEFLFKNFDFFDGNDLIAKLFVQEYEMTFDKKVSDIFYTIITLSKGSAKYNLIWHEDVGNYMYSTNQDANSILELENKLQVIIGKLNKILFG